MEALLAAIEGLGAVEALKRSFVVYPLVNALHILALGTLVTSAILVDLRVLGRFAAFDARDFERTFRRLALAAFALAAATGIAMFAVKARDYWENPAFLAKLGLLAAAGLNFAWFRLAATSRPGAGRMPALLSITLWIAILVAGRFIGFL